MSTDYRFAFDAVTFRVQGARVTCAVPRPQQEASASWYGHWACPGTQAKAEVRLG